MGEWTIAGICLAIAGLVMIGVGVPLVAGRIGRNSLYGYRTPTTLRDDRVWYPVNALSGVWLVWAGFLSFAIGLLLVLVRNNEETAQLVLIIGLGSLVLCIAVGIYRSWKLASAIDASLHAADDGAAEANVSEPSSANDSA